MEGYNVDAVIPMVGWGSDGDTCSKGEPMLLQELCGELNCYVFKPELRMEDDDAVIDRDVILQEVSPAESKEEEVVRLNKI